MGVTETGADESDAYRSDENFVLGNLEFVLLHEIAHLLIEDFDIPVLGPEEQAADYLATTVLLRVDRFNVERADRARGFLISTAEAFELSWQLGTTATSEIPYWSVHSLGIQRFYQIICLIYGSNPELFSKLPTRTRLPESRKSSCEAEYLRSGRAVDWVLTEFGRQPTDPVDARISISYEPASTRASKRIIAFVQASGLIENTARRLEERFAFPKPVDIVFRRCRRAEANWESDSRQLTICYELLELFEKIAKQRK